MSRKHTNQWYRDKIHEMVGGKYTSSKLSKETCVYALLESRGVPLTWFNMIDICVGNYEGEIRVMLAHEFEFDYVYNSEPPRTFRNDELYKIYYGLKPVKGPPKSFKEAESRGMYQSGPRVIGRDDVDVSKE